MSFADLVQSEINKFDNNGGNGEGNQDRYKQPHPHIQMGKGKTDGYEIYVRVVPLVQPDGHFGVMTRKALVSFPKDGQTKYQSIQVPLDDNSTYPEAKLNEWLQQGYPLGRFTPSLKPTFMFNVIKVFETNQGFQYNVDAQGNPIVQPMEIPNGAYVDLMKLIGDTKLRPAGCTSDYSFVSEDFGTLVKFEKPKQTDQVKKWTIQPYTNVVLPPLPQGWKENSADLQELSKTTTDTVIDKFVAPFVEAQQPLNGEESNQGSTPDYSSPFKSQATPQQSNQQAQANVPPQQPVQQPVQQSYNQPQQGQVGQYAQQGQNNGQGQQLQGNQQPISNTQFGQGTPSGQQPSNTGGVDWNSLAQQQSQADVAQPQQQPQQTQPQQQPNTSVEPPQQPTQDSMPDDVQSLLDDVLKG